MLGKYSQPIWFSLCCYLPILKIDLLKQVLERQSEVILAMCAVCALLQIISSRQLQQGPVLLKEGMEGATGMTFEFCALSVLASMERPISDCYSF